MLQTSQPSIISQSSEPIFFDRLEIRLKIESLVPPKAIEKILTCIRTNSYYKNGASLEKLLEVQGHHYSSMRISQGARVLLLTMGTTLIIMDYLSKHQYPTEDFIRKSCKAFLAHYHNSPTAVCRVIPIDSQPNMSTLSDLALIGNHGPITLDEEQVSACRTTLPAKIHGGPGAGKSVVGLIVLKNQTHGECAYYSKSPFLVKAQKELFDKQDTPSNSDVVRHFFSSEDLYPQGYTHSSQSILSWVEKTVNQSIPLLNAVPALYIVQELQTLHVLQQLFPDSFAAIYSQNFSRPSFYTPEQTAAIPPLYELLAKRFFNNSHMPFVEGFICRDPLPNKMFSFLVSDENQNESVAQNFFFFRKTQNAQILFLRDMKQNQDWQGIDSLSLCESILHTWQKSQHKAPLNIASCNLRRGYRNAIAITELANRRLILQNMWLQGTVTKDDYPLFLVDDPSAPHNIPGNVRLYNGYHTPEFQSIFVHFPKNSMDWAILTRPERKKEARDLFGDNVLIFDTQESPGLEFRCTIRWNATDRQILAAQNPQPLRELLANPDKPLYLHKSSCVSEYADLIRATAADVTITSRAIEGILIVEDPVTTQEFARGSKRQIVEQALQWLYPVEKYAIHSTPWAINMSASTLQEWEDFIAKLCEQGVMIEAARLFELHIQPYTALNFAAWSAQRLAGLELPELCASTAAAVDLDPEASVEKPALHDPTKLEISLPKTHRTPKKIVNSIRREISQQDLENIKNIIKLTDYSPRSITVESIEHLTQILFANAMMVQTDTKVQKYLVCSDIEQDNTFSFCSALATAPEEMQKVIHKKLARLLSLAHIKRYAISVDFFNQPCPKNLRQFISQYYPTKKINNIGIGLFWLILQFPHLIGLLHHLLSTSTSSVTKNLSKINAVLDFLKQDWTAQIGPDLIHEDILKIGYIEISNFFRSQFNIDLDLTSGHPDAILYNLIARNQSVDFKEVLSDLAPQKVASLLTYRSIITNLTAIDLLQREDNQNTSNFWEYFCLPKNITLYTQVLPPPIVQRIINMPWYEWSTPNARKKLSRLKKFGHSSIKFSVGRIMGCMHNRAPYSLPESAGECLSNALKTCIASLINTRDAFQKFRSQLQRIVAYENTLISENIARNLAHADNDANDILSQDLLHIFIEKKDFDSALELFQNGLIIHAPPAWWTNILKEVTENPSASTLLIECIRSQHSDKQHYILDMAKGALQALTDSHSSSSTPDTRTKVGPVIKHTLDILGELFEDGLDIFDEICLPLPRRSASFALSRSIVENRKMEVVDAILIPYPEIQKLYASLSIYSGSKEKIKRALMIGVGRQAASQSKKTWFSEALNWSEMDSTSPDLAFNRVIDSIGIALLKTAKDLGIKYELSDIRDLFKEALDLKLYSMLLTLLDPEMVSWEISTEDQSALYHFTIPVMEHTESPESINFLQNYAFMLRENGFWQYANDEIFYHPSSYSNSIKELAMSAYNCVGVDGFIAIMPATIDILALLHKSPSAFLYAILSPVISLKKRSFENTKKITLFLLKTIENRHSGKHILSTDNLLSVQRNTRDFLIFQAMQCKLFDVVEAMLDMEMGLVLPHRETLLLCAIIQGAPRAILERILKITAGEMSVENFLKIEPIHGSVTQIRASLDEVPNSIRTTVWDKATYCQVILDSKNVDALSLFCSYGYDITRMHGYLMHAALSANTRILEIALMHHAPSTTDQLVLEIALTKSLQQDKPESYRSDMLKISNMLISNGVFITPKANDLLQKQMAAKAQPVVFSPESANFSCATPAPGCTPLLLSRQSSAKTDSTTPQFLGRGSCRSLAEGG